MIFTTAYDEYAVRAFELAAVDYLLKPVRAARFAEALARHAESARRPMKSAANGADPTQPFQHQRTRDEFFWCR